MNLCWHFKATKIGDTLNKTKALSDVYKHRSDNLILYATQQIGTNPSMLQDPDARLPIRTVHYL